MQQQQHALVIGLPALCVHHVAQPTSSRHNKAHLVGPQIDAALAHVCCCQQVLCRAQAE